MPTKTEPFDPMRGLSFALNCAGAAQGPLIHGPCILVFTGGTQSSADFFSIEVLIRSA
jgi:hypothetical protein